MSTTKTRELTVADIARRCDAIAALVGRAKAEVGLSVRSGAEMAVSVHPDGICGVEPSKYFHGPNASKLLDEAEAWAGTRSSVWRDTLIRRLALAIIDITDQHGKCTDALLRGRKFTQDEITQMQEVACQRASEMCANAPFAVVIGAA